MSKYNYEGSEQYKPITAWGYIGYSILFVIPVIGWIFWIVCMFSSKNINRRSYARSFFCRIILTCLVFVVFLALAHFNVGGFKDTVYRWDLPFFNKAFYQVEIWFQPKVDTTSRKTETKATEKPVTTTDKAEAKIEEKTADTKTETRAEETTTTKNTGDTRQKQPTETTTTNENTSKSSSSSSSGSATSVRKEVKDAIDSYEAFFKKYADFMKKYTKSTNQLAMMSDYSKMMTQYAETMEKWEKFDKQYTLNNVELKYYTEANVRIQKMLIDALK